MNPFDFDHKINGMLLESMTPEKRRQIRREVIEEELPKVVEGLGWHFLRSGEVFNPSRQPLAVVVGVALWSCPDLLSLGRLAEKVGKVPVYVFNIDDLVNLKNLKMFVPSVKKPSQTPVLALYQEGRLVASYEGRGALTWINSDAAMR